MRYRVRNSKGEELVVPSLRELHDLYVHGFVTDDDLVRSESASRWVSAGTMPALHGVRETRAGPRRLARMVAAAAIVAAAIALLLGR
jgi:hypothetical protein